MVRSKLIEAISALNAEEFDRLGKLVHAAYFNKNKKIIALFKLIDKEYPMFKQEQLQKERIYPILFGNNAYNELQLNNIISDLLQLVYQFMGQEQFRKRKSLQMSLVMDELLEKDLNSHIPKIVKKSQLIQSKSTLRNQDYFLEEYHLADKLDRFFLTKFKRTYDENLQRKNDALDLYYHINKLRIACDMKSRDIVTGSGYQCHYLEDVVKHYKETERYASYGVLKIYYEILMMLENADDETFYFNVKEHLGCNLGLFTHEELRYLYNYLLNYCIKKINSGLGIYYKEVLEIYQLMLKERFIFKNGYLTHWTFKNIVTVGLRIPDYDWTESFILKYKENILIEDRQTSLAFNLANLYYAKKDFKNALEQLQDIRFSDHSYQLGAKIIQLKSYFELNEVEPFYALIEASRKFIHRSSQLSDYGKTANINFVKLCRQIFRLKLEKKIITNSAFEQRQRAIANKLKQTKMIANKDWLEEVFVDIKMKS